MLFLKERIEESIEILKMYEPKEGYYLAFSGGKDSVVLHEIARRSGVKFDSHYNITSVDPPELVKFIRKHYPSVSMDRPDTTMWELIPKKRTPPTRLVRYCCQHLKEKSGDGRIVLTGVKKTDSLKRRKYKLVTICKQESRTWVLPLFHWNDAEVWAFIRKNNLPYCELYDQGFTRLGCIGCPMAGPKKQKKEFERWPKYREAYLRAFDRMLKERKRRGKDDSGSNWDTAEGVMSWWLQDGGGRHVEEMTSGKLSRGD